MAGVSVPVLRVAQHAADLDALIPFYRDGLGLAVLGRFADHAGFDGILFGRPGAPYHLEFTTAPTVRPVVAPDPDDLLVFYLPDEAEWRAVLDRMTMLGALPVDADNPYWNERGVTFEDPDGRRVELQNDGWRR